MQPLQQDNDLMQTLENREEASLCAYTGVRCVLFFRTFITILLLVIPVFIFVKSSFNSLLDSTENYITKKICEQNFTKCYEDINLNESKFFKI